MSTDLRQLSDREIEILRLVSGGLSNQQIALQLGISANTVKVHLRNIFAKIGAASRTEATLYAVRTGLVTIENAPPMVADGPAASTVEPSGDSQQALAALILPDAPTEQPADAPEPPAPIMVVEDAPVVVRTPTERANAEPATVAAVITTSRAQDARSFRLMLMAIVGATVLAGVALFAWLQSSSEITGTPGSLAPATPAGEASRWKTLPSAPEGRAAFAVAAVNDVIYAIGGENESGVLGSVARFDPQFGTWTTLSSKPTPVADVQSVVLGGRIYVPGGRTAADSRAISRVFERYDPRTETWDTLPDLPAPRSAYGLAALEGKLYLFGGWDGSSYRGEVFEYDPDASQWRERTAMPTARAFMGAVVVDTTVYVMGGENESGELTNNETYSPAQEGGQPWTRRAPLPAPRSHFGTAAALTIIHVIGGTNADDHPLKYNVRTDSWQSFVAPPTAVGSQPGVVLLETNIVSLGGQIGSSTFAKQMQSYQALFTTVLP